MADTSIDPLQSGILLLDKPKGMTSNRAIQVVKRHFNFKKVGHTGTLDPMATGMLPVCCNETTKLAPYLLNDSKTYRFTLQLGQRTDTGDSDGAVIEVSDVPNIDRERIEKVLQSFLGEIEQVPPMYSALKHQGKPLYAYARKGQDIPRQARTVQIHQLRLMDYQPNSISAEVTCSTGTYVRVLAEDMARQLQTVGHLTALRRMNLSVFAQLSMLELDEVVSSGFQLLAHLHSHHDLPLNLPKVVVNEVIRDRLCQGQRVLSSDTDCPEEFGECAVYSSKRLIGIGLVSLSNNNNVILKLKRVIR